MFFSAALLYPTIYLLLSLLTAARTSTASSDSFAPAVPFPPDLLPSLLHGRSGGPDGVAVWTYTGTLTDASSGRPVADVEGVEVVRALGSSRSGDSGGLARLGDLAAARLLSGGGWDAQCTALHRRLFCYTAAASDGAGGGARRLLSSFVRRPGAKVRRVLPREGAALYDTAVTYVVRDDGRSLVAVSEFGDGRHAVSEATGGRATGNSGGGSTWDFGAHVRADGLMTRRDNGAPNGPSHKGSEMPPLRSEEVMVAGTPARTGIVSFGRDDAASKALLMKYGARESYSFRFGDETTARPADVSSGNVAVRRALRDALHSLPLLRLIAPPRPVTEVADGGESTIRYTRYGECPPYYSAGTTCALDLVGRRVEDLAAVPPVAAEAVARLVPGFAEAARPVEMSLCDALVALADFREGLGAGIVEDVAGGDMAADGTGRWWSKAASVARRLAAAIELEPSGGVGMDIWK